MSDVIHDDLNYVKSFVKDVPLEDGENQEIDKLNELKLDTEDIEVVNSINSIEDVIKIAKIIKVAFNVRKAAVERSINSVDWHTASELDDEHKHKFFYTLYEYSYSNIKKMLLVAVIIIAVNIGPLFLPSEVFLPSEDGGHGYNYPGFVIPSIIVTLIMLLLVILTFRNAHKIKEAINNNTYCFGYGTVTRTSETNINGFITREVLVNEHINIVTYTSKPNAFHVGEEIILLRVSPIMIMGIPNNK